MGFLQGEGPTQGTLFPVVLDDLVRCDHVCRVIDAFVGRLEMSQLGFERSEPAETGRPGYDPRDLLKLYLYGYLQQIRSSRRLEAEKLSHICQSCFGELLETRFDCGSHPRRFRNFAVYEIASSVVATSK